MHRALPCRWLTRALRTTETLPPSGLPLFLCPTAAVWRERRFAPVHFSHSLDQRRPIHIDASLVEEKLRTAEAPAEPPRKLPLNCSGCGAFTQTTDPQQLGYYDTTAKRVRTWLKPKKNKLHDKEIEENQVVDDVLKSMDSSQLTALGFDRSNLVVDEAQSELGSRMCLFCCVLGSSKLMINFRDRAKAPLVRSVSRLDTLQRVFGRSQGAHVPPDSRDAARDDRRVPS